MDKKEGHGGDGGGPLTWDAEEDHLLSYFLGGEQQQMHPEPVNGEPVNGDPPVVHTIPAMGSQNSSSSESLHGRHPPSTPHIQFYAPSTSTKQKPVSSNLVGVGAPPASAVMSASSSNSSLSSIPMIGPGAGVQDIGRRPPPQPGTGHQPPTQHTHHHVAFAQTFPPGSAAMTDTSPISPAAMIGTPENLMLPPPPRRPTAGGEPTPEEQQKAHLTWLQQINTVAMMASSNKRQQQQMHPPPQQQQPQMLNPATTPTLQVVPHAFPQIYRTTQPPVETEEKRARRLARNRESARQSRRRKKERLETLGVKVAKLHEKLDVSRRQCLNQMIGELQTKRKEKISEIVAGGSLSSRAESRQKFMELLAETRPNAQVNQGVIEFQYTKLRQLLLPNYQELILWLLLRDETFYTAARTQKAKSDPSRVSSGRASSKQIGEEITNKFNKGKLTDIPAMDGVEDKLSLRCRSDDSRRLWPLLCFELQISVDQEEKLVSFYRSSHALPDLEVEKTRLANADTMASSMQKGIAFQSHAVGMRASNTLDHTLTSEQAGKYLDWMSKNKDRVKRRLAARRRDAGSGSSVESKDIRDLSRRLAEVMRLPLTDN